MMINVVDYGCYNIIALYYRCGGLSMITMNSTVDDNYNWNSRWIAKCICGGSWFKL